MKQRRAKDSHTRSNITRAPSLKHPNSPSDTWTLKAENSAKGAKGRSSKKLRNSRLQLRSQKWGSLTRRMQKTGRTRCVLGGRVCGYSTKLIMWVYACQRDQESVLQHQALLPSNFTQYFSWTSQTRNSQSCTRMSPC